MTIEVQQNVLGVTEAYIAKVTTNTTTTYETSTKVKLPELSSLEITKNVETKEAKAGLKVVDSFSIPTGFDVKFENVNIPLDVIALINGSEVKHTGAAGTEGQAGTQKASVVETDKQVPVMFNLEAKSDLINGQAADIHIEMYCVKGTLDVKTTADDYWTCSFEGKAFARKKDGAYRDISINEVDTAIASA